MLVHLRQRFAGGNLKENYCGCRNYTHNCRLGKSSWLRAACSIGNYLLLRSSSKSCTTCAAVESVNFGQRNNRALRGSARFRQENLTSAPYFRALSYGNLPIRQRFCCDFKGKKSWKNTMSGAAQVGGWPQQLVRLSGTGKSRGVFMVTPTLAAAWQPAPQRRGRSSSSLHNPRPWCRDPSTAP